MKLRLGHYENGGHTLYDDSCLPSVIGWAKSKETGEKIVTACNSYDKNQETIKELTEALKSMTDIFFEIRKYSVKKDFQFLSTHACACKVLNKMNEEKAGAL